MKQAIYFFLIKDSGNPHGANERTSGTHSKRIGLLPAKPFPFSRNRNLPSFLQGMQNTIVQ